MKKAIALAAVAAFMLSAAPAQAFWWGGNNGSEITVVVSNSNSANVENNVETTASTGGNTANGGSANNNDVTVDDNDSDSTDVLTTARGGNGGIILTGDANATSLVSNIVNSNETDVELSCGCDEEESNGWFQHHRGGNDVTVTVIGSNSSTVKNTVDTKAKTGRNTANGGAADYNDVDVTDNGEEEENNNHHHWWGGNNNDDDESTVDVDALSQGGLGGSIGTGDADAYTSIVNMVGGNVARVTR